MRFLPILALVLACGPAGTPSIEHPEAPASVADPAFLEQWAATGGFRLGQPTAITITPDGSEVLFLRSGPRDSERDLYAFDVATGEERVVLTADQILGGQAETLSPEERALRERLRMTASGIASYTLSQDGSKILVPLSGKLFVVDRNATENNVRELPSEGGYANDAQFSPDGNRVACVREGDVYVIDVAGGTQRRLTTREGDQQTYGLAEFVAQEEMSRYHGTWWSPDSTTLVVQHNDSSDVETLYASNPIDPADPPRAARYPRAGTNNVVVRLALFPVAGGDARWIEWDQQTFPYLASVRWPKEGPLTVLVQDRRQQVEQILRVDPESGQTTRLHFERDEAWLNLDQSVPRWIDAEQMLWSTERDGQWQLERRGPEGANTLTHATLGYRELLHVETSDDGPEAVWVVASRDPTEAHVWRVPFTGEPTQISEGAGSHTGTFGGETDEGLVWVHTSDTVDEGPKWTVRRGAETVVGTLRSVAETPTFTPTVQHLTVGERAMRALVVRPRNFEPSRRYPVLLSVYAGPGYAKVRKGKYRQLREQWQADHGFIVVSVDGRGTPGRGRDWERVVRGDLSAIALEDQITGLRALGQHVGEMDLSRVGVYGWSFGGYFSAMAVMRHPEVFRVGVAGAPVGDWRDYDTHYTERFMDLPARNEEGYDAASVLTYASQLERPLMIIHGTSDDNVYFVHALKMHDALMRAGAEHEFVVLAGSTHMVADPEVARALQGRVMRFLSSNLAP